jgi:hypothetical protein
MSIEWVLDKEWVGEKHGKHWLLKRGFLTIRRCKTKGEAQLLLDAIGDGYRRLAENPSLLAGEPHPVLPTSNLTARDYVEWLLNNTVSYDGIIRALGLIHKASRTPVEAPLGDNVIPFRPRGAA